MRVRIPELGFILNSEMESRNAKILNLWFRTNMAEGAKVHAGCHLVPMRLRNTPLWLYLRSVRSSEKSVKL